MSIFPIKPIKPPNHPGLEFSELRNSANLFISLSQEIRVPGKSLSKQTTLRCTAATYTVLQRDHFAIIMSPRVCHRRFPCHQKRNISIRFLPTVVNDREAVNRSMCFQTELNETSKLRLWQDRPCRSIKIVS